MIARRVEEGRIELVDKGLDFIPLPREPGRIVRVTFNEISHADHECRLQQIDLGHGGLEHAWPMTARAVGHHDKGEILFRIVCLESRPRGG